jgi:ubiquinone/menaquinone biosynthesis C-methylase UbiE
LIANTDINLKFIDGIWVEEETRQRFYSFEEQYIHIRDKEQRIFSIDEIRKLPEVKKDHKHVAEWKVRQKSIERFVRFLKKKRITAALDIGCGTGFFANILSQHCDKVSGIEVNLKELKQAAEAFKSNKKIEWYYTDILNRKVFGEGAFDLITFCCSFQYFPDVKEILDTCFYYLKPGGSVHIIDSPFYKEEEQLKAQNATHGYYQSMGFDTLAQHYFHHTWDDIKSYPYKIHYQKSKEIFSSLFTKHDSPFPWIEIIKP